MTTNPKILKFLCQSDDDAANSLILGVEWEFSDVGELAGEKYDEDSDEVYQYLLGGQSEEEWFAELCGFTLNSRHSFLIRDRDELESLVDTHHSTALFSNLIAEAADNLNSEQPAFLEVVGWNHHDDGTRGIVQEYVTETPSNRDDIIRDCKRLLSAAGSIESPANGSFHIHVSIPGVRHSVSADSSLHCCLLWELSQLVEEFPGNFWDRFNAHSSYFNPIAAATDKYSTIHSHSQGTLEYRLFGHVEDIEDVEECLRIVCTSFVRGYRRFVRGNHCVHDTKAFRQRFLQSLENCEPMTLDDIGDRKLVNILAEGMVWTETEEDVDGAVIAQSAGVLSTLYPTIPSSLFSANPNSVLNRDSVVATNADLPAAYRDVVSHLMFRGTPRDAAAILHTIARGLASANP